MKIKLLQPKHLPDLHQAFNLAFSDYLLKIQLSEQQFYDKLEREGLLPETSAAAFEGGKIAGFIVQGLGEWQGRQTAYNGGTGVVPGCRGRSISTDIYLWLLPELRKLGVQQCLLEVIQQNAPALRIYRNLGFSIARSLCCFRYSKAAVEFTGAADVEIARAEQPDWELYDSFWECEPSWQNSTASVQRSSAEKLVLEARQNGACVGYAVVFAEAGGVAQVAVAPAWQRQGIGSALFRAAAKVVKTETVSLLNVDSGCSSLLSFLQKHRVPTLLSQYEMLLEL